MSASEGLKRIVRILSVLAWSVLAILTVAAVSQVSDPTSAGLAFALGCAVFAVLQGAAWVIAGFSGNPKGDDGLVSWRHIFRRRRAAAPAPTPVAIDPGPSGIGGWLLLLVIMLIALSPLKAISETWSGFDALEKTYPALQGAPKWATYKAIAWGIVLASAAVSFIAGYRLRNHHHPASVSFAIGALWFSGPISTALVFIASNAVFGVKLNDFFDTSTLGAAIGSLITAVIWTAYLKMSRRVRNTYFRQLYGNPVSTHVPPSRTEPGL